MIGPRELKNILKKNSKSTNIKEYTVYYTDEGECGLENIKSPALSEWPMPT